MPPHCPPEEQLSSLLAGRLEPSSAAEIEQHVETCDRCQETVRSLSVAEESFLANLRDVSLNPLDLEPGCERAMARIRAMAGDGPGATIASISPAELIPVLPLQTIREYQFLEKLGEGGMGAVYKALHTRLEKTVALKVLPADKLRDQGAVSRFQREMKAVGKLEHPNIVRAMDAGEVDGMHFLVMEYVQGLDLGQVAKRLGKLPIADACELVRQAAVGLSEAHEHGMVHRDIKPNNLILAQPRRKHPATVKILDLGLALLDGKNFEDTGLTGTGQMMGTIDYMAPEQCRSSHDVDIRADIYSLGATLYRLLAGKPPLSTGRDNSILSKLVALATEPAPPLRELRNDVPPELAKLVHRMIAKDPGQRFATPEEVVEALAPFCSGANLSALLKRAESEEAGPVSQDGETLANRKSQSSDTARPAARPYPQPTGPRGPWKQTNLIMLAAAAGALLLFGVVWLIIKDKFGNEVARIQVPPGGTATIVNTGEQPPVVKPAADNVPPPLAIAPFNAEQAKAHQQAWADHLGVPVKYTDDFGLTFRLIPPGEFPMGSTEEEIARELKGDNLPAWYVDNVKGEGPQHRVHLSRPFYLGATEVTTEQFAKFVERTKYKTDAERDGKGGGLFKDGQMRFDAAAIWSSPTGSPERPNTPVRQVSWNDARAFCSLLNQAEELGYRLPTEAEWEFACRAGTQTRFWNGDELTPQQAAIERPVDIVGSFPANPFGLYDMHGNATEWCLDTIEGSYPAEPVQDPVSQKGITYVFRGGSAKVAAVSARSAARRGNVADSRSDSNGFRVATSVEAVKAQLQRKKPVTTAANAPPPARAPFHAEQAKAHQQAWSDYLGVPVEFTNSLDMKFVLVPPGEFLMGSSPEEIEEALKLGGNDQERDEGIKSEAPQHKVRLTRAFYLSVHEITQREHQAITGKNPSGFAKTGTLPEAAEKVAGIDTAHFPVETVTWIDAEDFCTKLSEKEILKPFDHHAGEAVTQPEAAGYRLPTEAEWEFACRAGTTTKFWNGEQNEDRIPIGWFHRNSGMRTHAVGESKANPFGLFDMHGNVAEWVHDGWKPDFYQLLAEKTAMDPRGPFSAGNGRVIRGGSFNFGEVLCRSSFRVAHDPEYYKTHGIGYRVALSVEAARAAISRAQAPNHR